MTPLWKKKYSHSIKKNNKLEWYCCKFYNTIHKDEVVDWIIKNIVSYC